MTKLLDIVRRPVILAPALVAAFTVILFLRRGDTLLRPGVWAEEGTTVLAGIETSGIATLLDPIAGYYGTIPKLIGLIGFAISGTQLPLVTAVLGWLFSIGVGLVVAFAPTYLRWRPLAALVMFLIPTDPEVFGVGLYSLWWSGILIFIVALWRRESTSVAGRVVILILAGLSSPLILVVAPVLVIRAIVFRRERREVVVGAVGVAVAAIQSLAIVLSSDGAKAGESGLINLSSIVPSFFGNYLINSWTDSPTRLGLAGAALIVLMVAGIALLRTGRFVLVTLAYFAGASILISLSRIGDTDIHPVFAGPRYFFFPFVIFAWALLHLVTRWPVRALAAIPALALAVATVNASQGWSRTNDDLHWGANLVACTHFESYAMPVHVGGDGAVTWNVDLTGEQCRDWIARDPFSSESAGTPVPAYTLAPLACCGRATYEVDPIVPTRSDFEIVPDVDSPEAGAVVVGSDNLEGPASITFRLKRGDALIIRTSPEAAGLTVRIEGADFAPKLRPSSPWSRILFSNLDLPDEFDVTFVDDGSGDTWLEVVVERATTP